MMIVNDRSDNESQIIQAMKDSKLSYEREQQVKSDEVVARLLQEELNTEMIHIQNTNHTPRTASQLIQQVEQDTNHTPIQAARMSMIRQAVNNQVREAITRNQRLAEYRFVRQINQTWIRRTDLQRPEVPSNGIVHGTTRPTNEHYMSDMTLLENNRRWIQQSEDARVARGDNYEQLLRLDERVPTKKLTKQELDSLPTLRFKNQISDNDTSCSICFENYDTKSNLCALPCKHKFHSKCIKEWLNVDRTCPICRRDAINGTCQLI